MKALLRTEIYHWVCFFPYIYFITCYLAKNKNSKPSDDSHSSAKKKKKSCWLRLLCTPVTQNMLCLIFLMYVRTIPFLNYGGQETKKKKKNAVNDSDTHVTFKQGQGH